MTNLKFKDDLNIRNVKNSSMSICREDDKFSFSISNVDDEHSTRYNLNLVEAKTLAYFIINMLKEKEEDTFPF